MDRAMQNRAAIFRAVAFMLIVLALALVGPNTAEVAVHAAFIAQVVLVSGSFGSAARRKSDCDERDGGEEFDCIFHGDDCFWLVRRIETIVI